MQNSDEEGDLYFESLEVFSAEEDLTFGSSDYGIWLRDPKSVDERRRDFYTELKLASRDACDRITFISGAVSASSSSDCSYFCTREPEANDHADMNELDDRHDPPNCPQESPSVEDAREHAIQTKTTRSKWWKFLLNRVKDKRGTPTVKESNKRTRVKLQKKKCANLTALYPVQELQAHNGAVWTMKFSADGHHLATGGEDGVLRIWKVANVAVEASSKLYTSDCYVPKSVFHIEESPALELHGHHSDILDLAWSNSNFLLSSSTDGTVRLWEVGCSHCLNIFRHNNYVTCVQFNPVDDNIFVSGSVDGKVRVWGISEKRVIDWAIARDIITSICYQPDGNGIIVGSLTGSCRFYRFSDNSLRVEAEIRIQGRRKSGNKITGIQFLKGRSQRVVISCEDSKVRVFDGMDLVQKFRGRPNSGSQMSPSFTSTGRHVISVGEDSRVYMWTHDEFICLPPKHQRKSVRACEHFYSPAVSVAVSWCGFGGCDGEGGDTSVANSPERDALRVSMSNWFSLDGPYKSSAATWPEEKLPFCDAREDTSACQPCGVHDMLRRVPPPDSWGMVIVTAAWDGTVRTYHNYGLPVRL